MQIKRMAFYRPLELARSVRVRVRQLREKNELVDYLTFVPDGEPTLDMKLGKEIELLRALGIKIAVITNASLIWHDDVRQDLQKADWVCLKIDAVTPDIWRKINKPHEEIKLDRVLEGILAFAKLFKGELTSETMLIKGINDSEHEINELAAFLAKLNPGKAYLAIPTRPPTEQIEPAIEQTINIAYQTFSSKLEKVECLIGYEGNAFASTGNAVDDLFSITAVHPMREDAVVELLGKAGVGLNTITDLVESGNLISLDYQGKKFYMRKLSNSIFRDSSRLSQKN